MEDEKISKITAQATSLINGNIGETRQALKRYSKIELLNFIEELSLLTGNGLNNCLEEVKGLL